MLELKYDRSKYPYLCKSPGCSKRFDFRHQNCRGSVKQLTTINRIPLMWIYDNPLLKEMLTKSIGNTGA